MTSLLSQPLIVRARNQLRRSALARQLYHRWQSAFNYEERFAAALTKAIEPGTIAWDVGANVGFYTEKFLQRGARKIYCFEPAPAAARELREKFSSPDSAAKVVTILPLALADRSGSARMSIDAASPTNHLVDGGADSATITVEVVRADDAVAAQRAELPHVVKIDVEGFELEVLQGFGKLLESPELRAVFVEVHFNLLHERGLDGAPQAIQAMLSAAGFAVRWLDLSHLSGVRTGAPAH